MDGYYINLTHRVDRKNHMENLKQHQSFFSNVERLEAIQNKNGAIGCSLSHIKGLTELLKKNKDCYMILEDDFFIFDDHNFNEFINNFEEIKNNDNWDLITLTPRGKTIKHNYINKFHKIIENQTGTAYIIKHFFLEKLLNTFKNGVLRLMKGEDPNLYALDQCWKPLQLENKFIYFEKIFGGQLPCYSDIEKRIVDYNDRFKQQINF